MLQLQRIKKRIKSKVNSRCTTWTGSSATVFTHEYTLFCLYVSGVININVHTSRIIHLFKTLLSTKHVNYCSVRIKFVSSASLLQFSTCYATSLANYYTCSSKNTHYMTFVSTETSANYQKGLMPITAAAHITAHSNETPLTPVMLSLWGQSSAHWIRSRLFSDSLHSV